MKLNLKQRINNRIWESQFWIGSAAQQFQANQTFPAKASLTTKISIRLQAPFQGLYLFLNVLAAVVYAVSSIPATILIHAVQGLASSLGSLFKRASKQKIKQSNVTTFSSNKNIVTAKTIPADNTIIPKTINTEPVVTTEAAYILYNKEAKRKEAEDNAKKAKRKEDRQSLQREYDEKIAKEHKARETIVYMREF